ncbi:MAG: hypothetical protein WBK24_03210 [Dethiobacteria bacterium]
MLPGRLRWGRLRRLLEGRRLGLFMAMKEMVTDPQLLSLLEQDVNKSREHIRELQNIITGGSAGFQ